MEPVAPPTPEELRKKVFIEGVINPTVNSYMDLLNANDFDALIELFLPDGALQPRSRSRSLAVTLFCASSVRIAKTCGCCPSEAMPSRPRVISPRSRSQARFRPLVWCWHRHECGLAFSAQP